MSYLNEITKPLMAKLDNNGLCGKQDIIDLLTQVQIGYISVSRAADIIHWTIMDRTTG